MTGATSDRNTWSSDFAFYLGSVCAAVGLGSIWRFPYLVGTGGGSAFVFVFLLAIVLIATPLLVAEFMLGRRSRRSAPVAAGDVARELGRSLRWNAIGWLGSIAAYLIFSYYAVVAGWVMAYTWKCAAGALSELDRPAVAALWRDFLASPLELGAWHFGFVCLVGFFSARGLRGIELASAVRAPALLALLLILVVYALVTGDVRRSLGFAFAPNFAAVTPRVVLAAIGQAFYATGVGMAMMIAYGAYVKRGTSLVRSSVIISASILLVSLLSTLLVFPLVFRYGMDPAQGVELVFDVLPAAFAEMPAGRLIGTLFFLLLVFAALTPSIASCEPVVAWLAQRTGMGRVAAALGTVGSAWLLGILSVLSFNRLATWHPLGFLRGFENMTWFDVLNEVTSDVLLPVGAMLTSILIGWLATHAVTDDELSETTPFARRASLWLLRYICPLAILAVLIASALG